MRSFLWILVFMLALAAGSGDIGAGAVIAYLACMLAAVAAKVKSPKPHLKKNGVKDRPLCIELTKPCPPQFRRHLNGDLSQKVRKFKRVGSNLVVWLESTAPVVGKVKAPSTTWSQWGRSVLVKVKDPSAWSRWVKSLVRLTPASSKPRPVGPIRTKVIMPWGTEKKVWKLSKMLIK
jgi:hypothetical protein